MKKITKALCGLFVIILFSGCDGDVLWVDDDGIVLVSALFAICAMALYCVIKPRRKKNKN